MLQLFLLRSVPCGKPFQEESFHRLMIFEGWSEATSVTANGEYVHCCGAFVSCNLYTSDAAAD
ncbi:MAG: hypothetical protein K2G33_11640 [Duncaniella sp.]|nr:hypothetical protein [Duncaniella sp.]